MYHLILIIQTYVRKINRENSDLGGYKLYLTLSSVGVSDGCSILDIINALPAKSLFLYHEQYNGATINDMPPNYRNGGIIRILNIGGRYEIDFRRQNANSLLSPPEHYIGSVAGSNPTSIEWSKALTSDDFAVVRVDIAVASANTRTEITQMSSRGRYWIPVVDGHSSAIVSRPEVTYDGSKWYIFADIAQTYYISFYKYPVTL